MDRDFVQELASSLEAGMLVFQSAASEAWLWLIEVFFVPGNYLLAWLVAHAPVTADSLGIEATDRSAAALLSTASWVAVLLLAKRGYSTGRHLLARGCRCGLAAAHRIRMFLWRRTAPRLRIEPRLGADLGEYHIDALQTAILHAQSRQPPGHVMTALDVAAELGVRPLRAQQALDALKRLDLVEVSFATTDGFPGYLLTPRVRPSSPSIAR
jgi:hypothetical protein